MQRFYRNIVLSSPGKGGESGKSLPWSLPVYDKKDLVKLHCWDPHRCPEVPVVPWAWSPHCPENPALVPYSFGHTWPSPLSIQENALKKIQSSRSGLPKQIVSQVNQVFKHVRLPMEMRNLILGQTGFWILIGITQVLLQGAATEPTEESYQPRNFCFTCLNSAVRLG